MSRLRRMLRAAFADGEEGTRDFSRGACDDRAACAECGSSARRCLSYCQLFFAAYVMRASSAASAMRGAVFSRAAQLTRRGSYACAILLMLLISLFRLSYFDMMLMLLDFDDIFLIFLSGACFRLIFFFCCFIFRCRRR